MNFSKILALSPHTDDIELGCGGTLARLVESGADIFVANFSRSISEGSDDGSQVASEFKKSMSILGARYEMLDLPCRRLGEYRQLILDYLIKLEKANDFDLVFCHSTFDRHQDHETIQQEAFRAFKTKTIFGYELPWNCAKFSTDIFVKLEKRHLEKKTETLNCYKSQSHRPFIYGPYIKDLARVRGLQIQNPYAECFELIRGVI